MVGGTVARDLGHTDRFSGNDPALVQRLCALLDAHLADRIPATESTEMGARRSIATTMP